MTTRTIELLVPVAKISAKESPIAPRPDDLGARVIGFLDNTKQNTDAFLGRIEELLRQRFRPSEIVRWRKEHSALPADFIDELARQCDAVINGVGD